ncbi:PREDICTED: oocyte zinc finger protein XlCOF6.1-like isoform X2 [Papilio polytes]|uniref:oocyte zinc finger protein XlCOF6.1-like isoform X2 n=1 Tax=Papilio polytes TaxID=76194 RepID=UPI000675E616|nr:PREDICTED: oocyte zinc finger protein XlCOF6.1-like isoform X2 [Papilio polytes]
MDDCRICLKCRGEKDIFELEAEKVSRDSKLGRKMCFDCYRKIIEFEQFKTLALRNNAYWHDIQLNENITNEVLLEDEIKCENNSDNDISNNNEIIVKNYDLFSSDDEFLSVIKQIKCENIFAETKENDPVENFVPKKKQKGKKTRVDEKRNEICEECGKTVANLKHHRRLHKSLDERKCYKCKQCDKKFASYSARYRHNKVKHLGIKSQCDICDKEVVNLRAHKLMTHNVGDMRYVCVPCGRRFISQSALDLHSTIHTKQFAHTCDICDKKFRSKIIMLAHKRQVHDKEKSHLCQFCSKGFFKKYHLQEHLRSHTKEKPYQCPECKKFFATTNSLKTHRFVHSDVKMFACNLCDMTFSKPGYVRSHMVSHTKEKRYSCKYCDARFGRSDHRKRHEFTAHERNYGLTQNK